MPKQDSQFKPGQSGNPSGRPKGARNKSTVAAEALLDGESESLTRRCIDLAMEGDPTALRLCLTRILPVKRGGETHEGVIKAKYGDQVPPDVEPVTVSWLPQA
jgi:hypothetical protein